MIMNLIVKSSQCKLTHCHMGSLWHWSLLSIVATVKCNSVVLGLLIKSTGRESKVWSLLCYASEQLVILIEAAWKWAIPKLHGGLRQHRLGRVKTACEPRAVASVFNRTLSTALSLNAQAFTNNRTSQAVEPEKVTRKFYKNNSCALSGAGAYI